MPEIHFWEREFTFKVIGLFIKKKRMQKFKATG